MGSTDGTGAAGAVRRTGRYRRGWGGNLYVSDSDTIRELSIASVAAQQGSLTGTSASPVDGLLAGLTGDTTYYVRVVASSTAGITVGQRSTSRPLW